MSRVPKHFDLDYNKSCSVGFCVGCVCSVRGSRQVCWDGSEVSGVPDPILPGAVCQLVVELTARLGGADWSVLCGGRLGLPRLGATHGPGPVLSPIG